MRTLSSEPTARRTPSLTLVAREPESPWAAHGLTDLVPPASLAEARERRDELATLLGSERAAAADFLLALADFDRRRGWERLGHASLFAFLTRELGLSSGTAQLRLSAARLLPRHPAVEAALRSGRLCISAVGQLARVLTTANEAEVLPRFFGRSAREAAELTAELLPLANPPRRNVVTALPTGNRPVATGAPPTQPDALALDLRSPGSHQETAAAPASPPAAHPLHTCEVSPPHPERPRTPAVQPLTADLRRLHLTVSAGFLDKLAEAKTGLSHAKPRASMEQVLEVALDLLLQRQARRKSLVRRPRAARTAPTPIPIAPPLAPAPAGSRPDIPAAVEREVRLRDGDRCQWPIDGGGVCGSSWQVELDHIRPQTLGGPTEAGNLRCACKVHNQRAAALELGLGLVESARARPRRR